MKKMVFVMFVCLALVLIAGCSVNLSQQADDSRKQTSQDKKLSPISETENSTSEGTENIKKSDLPALDNVMSYIDFPVTISFPSLWSFSVRYTEVDDTNALEIDCLNGEILMWLQEAHIPGNSESDYREFYKNSDVAWESFLFDDGVDGYCWNIDMDSIVFAYVSDYGVYNYSISYFLDPEWYAENEVLIHTIAKSLTYNKASVVTSWKQIYLELLLTTQEYIAKFDWSVSDDYDSRYPRYITDIRLADLNFDGIPELVLCGESLFASSYVSIYTITENGAQMIFHELLNEGSGPILYCNPDDGNLFYGFTCLNALSDNYLDYLFTVYATGKETSLTGNLSDNATKMAVYTANYSDNPPIYTFNGQNVSEQEYDSRIDSLFERLFIEIPGYPVSIREIYPDDYKGTDYNYSESEMLTFFDLYSPEYAGNNSYAYIENSYEMIVSYYRDCIDCEGNRDEAIENFLANIRIEMNMNDEQQVYELKNSLYELFNTAAGYAICDINGDGSPELFIISEEYYEICAIYTMCGGNPILVGAYWSRNRCVIDMNGTIYINGSNGAEDSFSASYSLIPGGGDLQLIEMIGVESYDEQTLEELPEPRYYRVQNGSKTIIGEEEAVTAWRNFPDSYTDNPTKDSGLPYRIF